MDISIVRAAFELYLWSTDILNIAGFISQVREAIARLPPVKLNSKGLIQEWGLKDYGEHEPGHRHVSHLFGLYPGNDLNTPELHEAARRVLARRAAHGGGHTGWSRAWLLNLHARLGDAEGCGRHMDLLLRDSTLPNLLDNHPPFQIDGNFGGCAGILECLVQSTKGADGIVEINLLPACPAGWADGQVSYVRVLDGWNVSFSWKNRKVVEPVSVTGRSQSGKKAVVIFEGGRLEMSA